MQFLSDWSTPDHSVLLNFGDDVLHRFDSFVQTGGRSEAGGILLGTVHAKGILITKATKPTRADCSMRYMFQRSEIGHRVVARRTFEASGGRVRYLGEWHTHPQDIPIPSILDISEWRKLAKKRADKRPLLSVIVGRKSLYVELIQGDGRRIQLLSV